jgi:glycosyltransferase involved in cell wall biosynthesis
MEQYGPWFEQAGARITFLPLLSDAYLRNFYAGKGKNFADIAWSYLRRAMQIVALHADAVWIEKELFPFLPAPFERLLSFKDIPWAIDIDDAIFHNYDLSGNIAVRSLLADKLRPLLSRSALVTAGNEYLAQYARAHGASRVMLVPTVVNPRRYAARPRSGGEPVRVGWIGTATNERYLDAVIHALNELGSQLSLALVTVGAGELNGLTVPQERHEWAEDTEGELVGTFDIGVMPLADTPWERGKCGYKLIQYMAAARPVIASAVGVNPQIVTPEVGRLAATQDDWVKALLELASDADLRTRLGQNARERMEAEYSLDVTGPQILSAFDHLLAETNWPART